MTEWAYVTAVVALLVTPLPPHLSHTLVLKLGGHLNRKHPPTSHANVTLFAGAGGPYLYPRSEFKPFTSATHYVPNTAEGGGGLRRRGHESSTQRDLLRGGKQLTGRNSAQAQRHNTDSVRRRTTSNGPALHSGSRREWVEIK